MTTISADSYPSRGSGSNSGQADSGMNNIQRFAADNVKISPEDLATLGKDDSTPDRPTVQPEDLHHNPSAPRPGVTSEVHGAMHSPQTTRSYPSAALGSEGFPAGWAQAQNPQAAE
jgi:hypothetical protein